jgi:hypothetical protein
MVQLQHNFDYLRDQPRICKLLEVEDWPLEVEGERLRDTRQSAIY